jgi:predicted acyltransferase
MLIFALFYWIIDVRGHRRWAFPFIVIGLNAILIYVLDERFDFKNVANIVVAGIAHLAGSYRALLLACSALAVKWLFLYFLYRQKIFLKA